MYSFNFSNTFTYPSGNSSICNRDQNTVLQPFDLPEFSSPDYPELLGYMIYIKSELGRTTRPSMSSPVFQTLAYKKVLLVDATTTSPYIDLGSEVIITDLQNLQSASYPNECYTQYLASENTNVGIPMAVMVNELRYQFLGNQYIPGGLSSNPIDFCFVSKDSYRYLLSSIFENNEEGYLVISGSYIVLGETAIIPTKLPTVIQNDNIIDPAGYFTLKLEVFLNSQLQAQSGSSAPVPYAGVVLGAPCPPLWHPGAAPAPFDENPDAFYTLFRNFVEDLYSQKR